MQPRVVISLLASATLAACASSPLNDIKSAVDSRLTYRDYAARDYTAFPASGTGNCAVFAASYAAAAQQRGITGRIEACLLLNGSGHAFFSASHGRVLDVRQQGVGTLPAVGCISGTVRVVKDLALR